MHSCGKCIIIVCCREDFEKQHLGKLQIYLNRDISEPIKVYTGRDSSLCVTQVQGNLRTPPFPEKYVYAR